MSLSQDIALLCVIEAASQKRAREERERADEFIQSSPKDRTITIRIRRVVDTALNQKLGELEVAGEERSKNDFLEEAIINALGGPVAVYKLVTE